MKAALVIGEPRGGRLKPLRRIFSRDAMARRGCVFLDRDGVINEMCVGGYVTSWAAFAFRSKAVEALRLASAHFPLVVVTNQRCVSRGIADADDISLLMDKMCAELANLGVDIWAWYACPHDNVDGCSCRKPQPGMLLAAAADLGIDLQSSFMIGDSQSDVAAGEAAGCNSSFLCDASDPGALVRAIEALTGGIVNA